MRLLLDTHILLWAAADMLPASAAGYILNEENELFFSPASIWEVVIKRGLSTVDESSAAGFDADPYLLHSGLLENGYKQLSITSRHALLTGTLPKIHKDPFDRILLAQSIAEGIPLLTADSILAKYPASVILIKK